MTTVAGHFRFVVLAICAGMCLVLAGCPTLPKKTVNPSVLRPPPDGARPPKPSDPHAVVPQKSPWGPGDWWIYPCPEYPGYLWFYDPIKKKWYQAPDPRAQQSQYLESEDFDEDLVDDAVSQVCCVSGDSPDQLVSAEAHLAAANLDSFNNTVVEPVGILFDGEVDYYNYVGTLDVTIPMRGDINFMILPAYNLRHEMYSVASEIENGVDYWTIRIVGDADVVLGFLIDSGFEMIALPEHVIDFMGTYEATSDEERTVYFDGTPIAVAAPKPLF